MENFPNLDPTNLVVFYVVVTEKSLTSAAEKLFLTQPAITYRIKSLEEYTRVKLLDIKKHQVFLTPAGEEVFKYAREIFQQLSGADRYIKSIRESNLRVGIASVYNATVAPVLNAIFEEQKPEMRFTIENGNSFEMVQSVLDSKLDIAIVPRFNYTTEKVKTVEISVPIKLVCFAGREQVIDKQPLDWKYLNNYPLVAGPQSSVVRRLINEQFRAHGIEMRPLTAEVDNVEWCIALVERGKGLSFALWPDIEKRVNENQLKIVHLTDYIYLSADAIMPQGIFVSPIINRFLSMVKQAFNSIPDKS